LAIAGLKRFGLCHTVNSEKAKPWQAAQNTSSPKQVAGACAAGSFIV
jgi:hypothetical protein